jgi:hypothetical protein
MQPQQIAVRVAQLMGPESLDRFHEEVHNSPFEQDVKDFIFKEFYHGCDIQEKVRYMMNYHIDKIRVVGFTFDWVLRNREVRSKRMGR